MHKDTKLFNLDDYLSELHHDLTLMFNESLFGHVLDVGCGRMKYRSNIENIPEVSSYVGIDIESVIALNRGRPDVFYDGKAIPLGSDSIDSAICISVLEHIAEPSLLLGDLRRVLKKNGLVFFQVPYIWPNHDSPHDFFRYTSWGLTYLLQKQGFKHILMGVPGLWNSSLQAMTTLWLQRSGLASNTSNILIQKLLNQLSPTTSNNPYYNQVLYPCLYCIASEENNLIAQKNKLSRLGTEMFPPPESSLKVFKNLYGEYKEILPPILKDQPYSIFYMLLSLLRIRAMNDLTQQKITSMMLKVDKGTGTLQYLNSYICHCLESSKFDEVMYSLLLESKDSFIHINADFKQDIISMLDFLEILPDHKYMILLRIH